jgi:hypothetical protein
VCVVIIRLAPFPFFPVVVIGRVPRRGTAAAVDDTLSIIIRVGVRAYLRDQSI